jgi:hypothetical protein
LNFRSKEGRPLYSSDEEGGLVKPKARNFPPEQEIFMVRIVEIQPIDEEGSEHLQLDDYYIDDDYIFDTPGQDTDTMMKYNGPKLPNHVHDTKGVVNIEDEDDLQKERCRFRNAKCTKRRQRTLEQQQHQPGNLYDFSTTDLPTSSTSAGTLAISLSPGTKSASR